MILLDTPVVLWALQDGSRIGQRARRAIGDADVRYISAVTHLELAIKGSLINLRAPDNLAELATNSGLTPLPLEARHALAVNRFPQLHRHDPFDRMLLAQADVDQLAFVTADHALLDLNQTWIIDATE